MKYRTRLLALLLGLFLLAGCTNQGQSNRPPEEETDVPTDPAASEEVIVRCRIVDGAEEGSLLLAEEQGSVMRLGTKAENYTVLIDGKEAAETDLRDGMLVDVHFSGMVQETYPGGYDQVTALEGYTEGLNDRCGLYLQVLEDLWDVDPGLNTGITELGVDLSGLTDLTDAEKSAVAWRFGETHALTPIEGTWAQLCELGYIDGENLYWEDGCLFSLNGSAEDGFEAEKWASGLGAYFFLDCTARQARNGSWTYKVGSEAIS